MAVFRARWAVIALGVLLGSGCATFSSSFAPIERSLGAGNPQAALAALERQTHLPGDRALYLLNKGMLLRMVGDFQASNEAFEAAKPLMQTFSAVSVTEQAASFVINDAARSYAGEPFERVLLHVYEALNYLALDKPDEARVEALQADLRMREYAERLSKQRYHDDPLAHYVSGKIFEARGERSDAMIEYRKAYEAYRARKTGIVAPRYLGNDLAHLSRALGLTDEYKRYRETFGDPPANGGADHGEIVFLLHEGLAPIKREKAANVMNYHSGRLVRLSLPYYQRRPAVLSGARLAVADKQYETELLEDVGEIAVQDLDAQMPIITARALARMVAKDQAARRAGKQDAAVGLAVNVLNVLTERADTRGWLTLPDRVHVASVSLPAGKHDVTLSMLGYAGQVIATHTFRDVSVVAGGKRFLSYHWISPSAGSAGS